MRTIILICITIISAGSYAQKAFIKIESQPGVSVKLDTSFYGITSQETGKLTIEDVSPGTYHAVFQLEDKIISTDIVVEDDNERIYFVDFINNITENQSPVNRPSKYALLEYNNLNATYGLFKDKRDGKEYKTIIINGQVWMAENMNYIIREGSFIFPKDPINESVYGRLYTWDAAMDACPEGWHLPGDKEWKDLEVYLGMNNVFLDARGWRETGKDSSLKSSIGWLGSIKSKDDYGFSAFPGGYFDNNFIFCCEGFYGYFWTSTEGKPDEAWYRVVSYDLNLIGRFSYNKKYGFSVRCIKD